MLQHLVKTQYGRINEKFITNLKLGGSHTADDIKKLKDLQMKEKRASYAGKVHSAGQEIFTTCLFTNQWIQGDLMTMKTRIFINSIKLRTNTFETSVHAVTFHFYLHHSILF